MVKKKMISPVSFAKHGEEKLGGSFLIVVDVIIFG
jgi:hypothetical protein